MAIWIVLAILVLIILIRDELRNAPIEVEDPFLRENCTHTPEGYTLEYHVPVTRKETDELLKAYGIESSFLKDYTQDEEFCKKFPCDYMKPYRFPDGKLTYRCTNSNLWGRIGVEKQVLQSLNEGCFEQCARCSGLPCRGERKKAQFL